MVFSNQNRTRSTEIDSVPYKGPEFLESPMCGQDNFAVAQLLLGQMSNVRASTDITG